MTTTKNPAAVALGALGGKAGRGASKIRGTPKQRRAWGRMGGRPPKPTAEELRAQIAGLEAKGLLRWRSALKLARLRDELADREWKLKSE